MHAITETLPRILLFIALFGWSLGYSQSSKDPRKQVDLYQWKAPYDTPDIAAFVDVPSYQFTLLRADNAIATRIKAAMKTDFPEQCDQAATNWPIYQYDVGKDGRVFLASCLATSTASWSVYYQLTPQNKLKSLRFRTPVLARYDNNSNGKAPGIVGYQDLQVLRDSQIVQRRVISDGPLSDATPPYHDAQGDPRFTAEWIWKQGHGFALLRYTFHVYDKEKNVNKTLVYP
ncbi:MAG: hypothetical protein CMH54_08285 [Myxococcales bacterium]|nr:hypothetical protein [Myxococcales bacterium]|tara:strand:- start:140 stop:832 length:693 start_codon:yes stop_codon:yes gene_type:complete